MFKKTNFDNSSRALIEMRKSNLLVVKYDFEKDPL
jgi:hypothetical protein